VALVRPRRYFGLGDWFPHVNLYTLPVQPKKIDRIEFVSGERGVNPALLGVTIERARQPAADKAIAFVFGTGRKETERRVTSSHLYQAGGVGWESAEGLKDEPGAVSIYADNTFLARVAPGAYRVTLQVCCAGAANTGLSLAIQGKRRLNHALIPSEWTQELRFETEAPKGEIQIGFHRTGFNRQAAVRLYKITLNPIAQRTGRAPKDIFQAAGLQYGWDNYNSLSPSSRYLGLMSIYWQRPKSFHVAVPDGKYAVELMMTAWYPGHTLYVNVTVEGKKALASQFMQRPKVYRFETEVQDGRLDMTIESDQKRTNSRAPRWEINSLILRPL